MNAKRRKQGKPQGTEDAVRDGEFHRGSSGANLDRTKLHVGSFQALDSC